MKVYMPAFDPQVIIDQEAHRSVVLKLRSLRIAMTPAEALALSNLLVDSAEKVGP